MSPVTILLLDLSTADGMSDSVREILEDSLPQDIRIHHEVVPTSDAVELDDITRTVSRLKPTLLFLAVGSGAPGAILSTLRSIRTGCPDLRVIVAADACEPDVLLELLRGGASDFITPPFKTLDIVPRVWRLLEQGQREVGPTNSLKEKFGLKRLVGESAAFVAEVNKFPVVARCDANILILGETGTGKELCARAIHYLSPRGSKPFVPVNCGAIPFDLVENELFGHEREAFTGAATSRLGLIHEAGGGTLFMDEIDCLPPLAQVKLLRFLQDKEYRPLGSMKTRHADVRVMAATNVDLEEAVRSGKIRQDLYYRLSVIPLTLPPLRERRGDIPLLARHFLTKYADEFDVQISDVSQDAMDMLLAYDWPGNVRELEHVIERAVVMSEQSAISHGDIRLPRPAPRVTSFREMKAGMIAQFERSYIHSLLRAHDGNITRAARTAQKDPRALRQLMRKHQIDGRSFRPRA